MSLAIASTSAAAEPAGRGLTVDLPAASLPEAIAALSRDASVSIGTDGMLPPIRTPRLRGRMNVDEALARLLSRSGYEARQVGPTAWRIERAQARARSPAPRQPNVPLPPPAVGEPALIVVTAGKQQQMLDALPLAVSVVSLKKAGIPSPGQGTAWLSNQTEGVALTNLGPGRNRMFLRGVADSAFNGDSQSTVAIVLDDVRLTYAAPDPDIRLVDVDRVELLKGPQGSLYGTGALGGIYHIVTRRAVLDETSAAASVGAGALASGGIGYNGSILANFAAPSGQAAVRLVGYSAREAGWVDTGARANANVNRVFGLRAGIGLDAGDDWRIDITAFAQWLNSRDSQYVYRAGARSRADQVAEPHDNDMRHVSLRVARQRGAADIVFSSGVSWHEVGDILDATIGADGFGLPDPQRLADTRGYRVWDNEARLNGSTGRFQWLIGASYLAALQNRARTLFSATQDAPFVIDTERRTAADSAVFGNITTQISDDVKLDLGGRLFHSVARQSSADRGMMKVDEHRRNGITPSAAVSWSPRPGRLLFLRYGSAFRQGVIAAGQSGASTALKGDEFASIEAGWRETLAGGGRLDAGAYFGWWDHVQSDVLRSDGLYGTETAGNARIAGAEVSFDMPLAPSWNFRAGATVTRARLVSTDLGFVPDDRRMPVVPDYTARGGVTHELRLHDMPVSVRADLRYIGPMHLSFDPAIDRRMGGLLESQFEVQLALDSYFLALAVENILDRRSDSFAFGNPLRFSGERQYTPQRPISISLTLSRRF